MFFACRHRPAGTLAPPVWYDKNNIYPALINVLIEGVPAEKAVVSTRLLRCHSLQQGLIRSGILLTSIDKREFVLKNSLLPLQDIL